MVFLAWLGSGLVAEEIVDIIWLETYCSCEFLHGPRESFKNFLLFTLLFGVCPQGQDGPTPGINKQKDSHILGNACNLRLTLSIEAELSFVLLFKVPAGRVRAGWPVLDHQTLVTPGWRIPPAAVDSTFPLV